LYQHFPRTRLAGDTLQLVRRRVIVLAWVPLMLTMMSLEAMESVVGLDEIGLMK
jgi:hypothetical protein